MNNYIEYSVVYWMNILDFVWKEFLIESFLGLIQWKNEWSLTPTIFSQILVWWKAEASFAVQGESRHEPRALFHLFESSKSWPHTQVQKLIALKNIHYIILGKITNTNNIRNIAHFWLWHSPNRWE